MEQTAARAIHEWTVERFGDNHALNGCECPKCGNTTTYDLQMKNNYYFVCCDCKQAVAIWLEDEIQDIVSQPWILLYEPDTTSI